MATYLPIVGYVRIEVGTVVKTILRAYAAPREVRIRPAAVGTEENVYGLGMFSPHLAE